MNNTGENTDTIIVGISSEDLAKLEFPDISSIILTLNDEEGLLDGT